MLETYVLSSQSRSQRLEPSYRNPRTVSQDFLSRVDALVDEGYAQLREDSLDKPACERLPAASTCHESLPLVPPARFLREPDIFLPCLRFGRTRLFLSRFIGAAAWFRWSLKEDGR